jgi:hypothetical protein
MQPEDKHLCSDCVGEGFLRAEIENVGKRLLCSYCGERGKSFTLEQMADAIEIALREHFYQTPTDPDALEYAMAREGEWNWERKGNPVKDVIQQQAEITSKAAEDVRKALHDRHYDRELAQMGEEGPYDREAHYAERDVGSGDSQAMWLHFEESLKTEGRFFSATAQKTLDSVFEGLAQHKTHDGRRIIVDAGPGSQLPVLYRARVFQSDKQLEEALKRPDREVGPPPPPAVPSGRMNVHGIAVFYGAEDPVVALAEVRPPIGSKVVVVRFELTRNVRLLDVEALRSVYVEGSIFDPGYLGRLERGQFLQWLSQRISTPVLPDDEPFDYIPTQVIAEYLASEATPALDGIIYPSARGGGNKSNVVLFHKAARVQSMDIPKGTTISANLYNFNDEGAEPDYSVWETEVAKMVPFGGDPAFHDLDVPFASEPLDASGPPESDCRQPTLRADISGVEVHEVKGITFKTDRHEVRRRHIKRLKEKF